MSKEKTKGQLLSEELLVKQKHIADVAPESVSEAFAFCEKYKEYLDAGKTERECTQATLSLLEQNGYEKFAEGQKIKPGQKIVLVNRDKMVIAATIGKKNVDAGVRLTIAHLDAPRLDLKPNPLYEVDQMALFKTHYYGGIRKYQWATIPLSMHGLVVTKNGEKITINIGEKLGEPVFTISDLLPHLAREQNKRNLGEGIKGEELNILVGSLPFDDTEVQNRVKLETMRWLNEKYGIIERDFARAELEFVPAFKASDVGFDASMVGAYGQDDRVCCYTALQAEIDMQAPEYTTICVLTDKEETGSDGTTGLAADFLFHFLEELAAIQNVSYRKLLASSVCVSADVEAAFDPTFADAFDHKNAAFLNQGVAIKKYGGARGKSGTSDAPAELVGYIANLLDKKGVVWQPGEMGKVDLGGGGTIAKFVANRNVDVIDLGVPVLSMHSPFEITAKLDIYHAYLAFKAFAEDDGPV